MLGREVDLDWFFAVNLIHFTWWRNLKDQFRNVVKAQKSGSGGTSKETKRVQWHFNELHEKLYIQ